MGTVRTRFPDEWGYLLSVIGLGHDHRSNRFVGNGVVTVDTGPEEEFGLAIMMSSEAGVAAGLRAAGTSWTVGEDARTVVRPASGPEIRLESFTGRAPGGELAVMPIWYGQDLSEARTVLDVLGLRERIAADSGVWAEFEAPDGGVVALHADLQSRVELAFSYRGDLDVLGERMRASGLDAAVVDEAYNRTVHVPTPSGSAIHINGPIEDLYGFHRVR